MTYPSMLRRSLSTSIDALVVVGIAMAISALLGAQSEAVVAMRVLLLASLVVNYEPVLVSKSRTVGQWLVGIRVRRRNAPDDRIGRQWLAPERALVRTSVARATWSPQREGQGAAKVTPQGG